MYPGCGGGSPWGGCNETDISYFTPAFFRHFATISGDESWKKLADDTQLIRDAAANSKTGLEPDWQSVSGKAGAGARKGYYSFDAIRAPYKQTMDYLWHGTKAASDWAKKLTNWAYGVGVSNLKDEYNLDGGVRGNNHNMAAVGSFAVAAMANTQAIADAFAAEAIKLKDDYWYSGYLGNLYLLALSGNMWTPEIVANQKTPLAQRRLQHDKSNPSIRYISKKDMMITGIHGVTSVNLMSLNGQILHRIKIVQTENGSISTIPDVRSGCYLLRVVSGNKTMMPVQMISVIE